MSKMSKVKSPDGKTEIHSIQNANDLVQHLGWTFVNYVDVQDGKKDIVQAQDVIDNARQIVAKADAGDRSDLKGDADEKAEVLSAKEVAEINKASKAKADKPAAK